MPIRKQGLHSRARISFSLSLKRMFHSIFCFLPFLFFRILRFARFAISEGTLTALNLVRAGKVNNILMTKREGS